MNEIEYQNEIINALILNEKTMGELYELYSRKFPLRRDFWLDLVKEEEEHVNWIKKLTGQIGDDSIYFNKFRIKNSRIQSSLSRINKRIAEAQKKEVPLTRALSIGFDLEQDFLEKRFFEVFKGDSPYLKNTFILLRTATKEHREKLKNAIREEKLNYLLAEE